VDEAGLGFGVEGRGGRFCGCWGGHYVEDSVGIRSQDISANRSIRTIVKTFARLGSSCEI